MPSLRLALLALCLALATPAFAVQPDEVMADPAMESRARALSANLRCMVCQNQSIDDSDAELARDLRLLVRERLKAGDSDEAVIDYLVSRYGEFVLLKPRLNAQNMLLWAAPALILLIGGIGFASYLRRRPPPAAQVLSETEKSRIDALLDKID